MLHGWYMSLCYNMSVGSIEAECCFDYQDKYFTGIPSQGFDESLPVKVDNMLHRILEVCLCASHFRPICIYMHT